MKRIIKLFAVILAVSFVLSLMPLAYAGDVEMKEYGFVDCGDIKMEYGIYGNMNAEPLLLLPPNGGDMHCFDDSILPEMSKHFKVITVSPRGTGNSGWVDGTMNFETMAEDLVKLLDYLNIEKTHIFGFSDGGNLGFVFTLAHQDRVKSLVVMGYIVLCIEAWIKGDEETKIRRDIKGMMVGQPSLTFKDISEIKVPVLNIYGEHDMIQRWHSKKITRSIEGAQELMVIGGGHSTCFEYTDTIINPTLLKFYGITA